jgi:hypothetical protein
MKTKPYQQHLLLAAFAALSTVAVHAHVDGPFITDPVAGGIKYRWYVELEPGESLSFDRHVGAWSWEDNSLFGPGDDAVGWTHTSDWVALTLNEATTFTLRLARQAGVPWPSAGEPGRTASIASMFPSFTGWAGIDQDLMPDDVAAALGYPPGTEDDHHTYNNDGPVVWAEDLTGVVGFVNNSTESYAEATFTLPAGEYSFVLGSNAPANDSDRQGYRATFTAVPEPTTAVSLLAGLGVLALRRRRTG